MKLHRNIYIWYTTSFLSSSAFTLPIWVIFNTQVLGLSNTKALALGMLAGGLSAFFEIPTGSWADKYGRARTYQIGTFFYILSVISYIFLTNFYALVALQVVGALGMAMQSGGVEALVHDSIKGKDKDAIYAKVHGHKVALGFASRVVTVLLSGVLYAANPKAPFVVLAVTYTLSLIVGFWFKEVRTETPSQLSHVDHIKETAALMLSKKTLITFLGLAALYTFCAEALFALYQPYFKSVGIHIGQFGIFYAVISALSAFGALYIGSLVKRFRDSQIILAMIISTLFTLCLMLAGVPALLYLAVIPSSIGLGFGITLANVSVQKLISSSHQATALSITSFLRNSAFFAGVVCVGISLDATSPMATVGILAVVTAICTMVILRVVNKKPTEVGVTTASAKLVT